LPRDGGVDDEEGEDDGVRLGSTAVEAAGSVAVDDIFFRHVCLG
jgi:hypothetical protein